MSNLRPPIVHLTTDQSYKKNRQYIELQNSQNLQALLFDSKLHRSFSRFSAESQTNLNNPTSNTKKCDPCFGILPILHPFGPFKVIWDSIVILVLLITIIAIPYVIAFNIESNINELYGKISLTLDIILLIDIIISFRTAYFDKIDHLRLITAPINIITNYIKSWFIIDFLTSFPFEFVININDNENILFKSLRIFRFVRLIRLLRLVKIIKLLDGFVSQFIVRELLYVIKFIRIIFKMLVFAHVIACLWYYVGRTTSNSWIYYLQEMDANEFRELDDFTKYTYSMYWAVITLFTTGNIYIYHVFIFHVKKKK